MTVINGTLDNDQLDAPYTWVTYEDGHDYKDGTWEGDLVNGLQGNDTIRAYVNDVVNGGIGQDSLSVIGESDVFLVFGNQLNGGDGNDTLSSIYDQSNQFNGDNGDDRIYLGSSQQDYVEGGDGSDLINVIDSVNCYSNGGIGNDTLSIDYYFSNNYGPYGKNIIDGSVGNDKLYNGTKEEYYNWGYNFYSNSHSFQDTITGGVGDDTLYSYISNSTLKGDSGNDSLSVGKEYAYNDINYVYNNTLNGGSGDAG